MFVRFHVVLFLRKNRRCGRPVFDFARLVRLAFAALCFWDETKKQKEHKTAITFQSGINLIEKTRLRASLRPVKSPDSRNALAEVREPGKTSPIRPAGTSFGEKPTKYTRRVR